MRKIFRIEVNVKIKEKFVFKLDLFNHI